MLVRCSGKTRQKRVKAASRQWHVYLVRCADGTLYTGVAIDVAARVAQHNGTLAGGARYTRARRPVKLLYREQIGRAHV